MHDRRLADAPVLELTGIDKQFNGVPALRGVRAARCAPARSMR